MQKTQAANQIWLSKREVAQRYGVHPRSIERWQEAGTFPRGTQMPNGHWFWNRAAIEQHERSLVGGSEVAA
jgi:hypothetical protein